MALQNIIPTSVKIPGSYVEIIFGAGRSSALGGAKEILLFGNKLSTSTEPVNSPRQITSVDEAISVYGDGSELARMVEHCIGEYSFATVSCIAIEESAGTAASGTITVDTVDAGALVAHVAGERFAVPVSATDSATDVAAALADEINGDGTSTVRNLPVTASAAAGVVTLTSKQSGPRGNWIHLDAESSDGITFTLSGNRLTGGATSDDPQDALDAVESLQDKYYFVAPYDTSTELLKFRAMVNSQAEPLQGVRMRFLCASIDTLGTTSALADSLEEARRGELAWMKDAVSEPAMIAAALGGAYAALYETDRASNADYLTLRTVRPSRDVTSTPTKLEINSALLDGVTPLTTVAGQAQVVRATTLDPQTEPHVVEVCDALADQLQLTYQRFDGFKLGEDVDGEVPDPGIATPLTIKDATAEAVSFFGDQNLLTHIQETIDGIISEADENTLGRVKVLVPANVIDLLHQVTAEIRQVG